MLVQNKKTDITWSCCLQETVMFRLLPLKVCYEATFAVTRYPYDMWHSPCTTHAVAYFMADNLLSNFVTPVACGPLKREQGSLPLWWWYRTDSRNWWNPPPTVVGEEVKGMSNKERKATDIVLYFFTSQGLKWGKVGNTGLKRKYRGKGNF